MNDSKEMLMKAAQNSHFVLGAVSPEQWPQDDLPQVAFAGRSNVGKSSLLNLLLGRRLAKTSQTPGKTREINFFKIDESLYFADLPGFGYAKMGGKELERMRNMTEQYLRSCKNLAGVIFLLDVRHPENKTDIESFAWFKSLSTALLPVATKCDKLGMQQRQKNMAELKRIHSLEEMPIPTSSFKKTGAELVWAQIAMLIKGENKK